MACTSLSGWHGSRQRPITGSVGALPTASGVPTGSPVGRQNDNVLTVSIVSAEASTVEPLSTRAFSSNLLRPGALHDTLSLTTSKKQSAKFAYSDTDRSIALIVVSTRRSSTALNTSRDPQVSKITHDRSGSCTLRIWEIPIERTAAGICERYKLLGKAGLLEGLRFVSPAQGSVIYRQDDVEGGIRDAQLQYVSCRRSIWRFCGVDY